MRKELNVLNSDMTALSDSHNAGPSLPGHEANQSEEVRASSDSHNAGPNSPGHEANQSESDDEKQPRNQRNEWDNWFYESGYPR